MTPTRTTEGLSAASCTRASTHALCRVRRSEMSALRLLKDTSAVAGREQDCRSNKLSAEAGRRREEKRRYEKIEERTVMDDKVGLKSGTVR